MKTEELKTIPTENEEIGIRQYSGNVFKNIAKHCRPRHLFPAGDLLDAQPEWINAIELYLANFCEPVRNIANEVHCVACNQKLTGPQGMVDWKTRGAMLVDTTIPTKEGRCSGCAYPVRCDHRIELPDGRLVVHLSWFPMQYHPSTLSGRTRNS